MNLSISHELARNIKYSLVENRPINQGMGKVPLAEPRCYFESLLEKLSSLLIKEGIDSKTDEPNELGLQFETLIDKISRAIYTSEE